MGDLFHTARTHPLWSVDVPFGGYEFDLHLLLISGKLCQIARALL